MSRRYIDISGKKYGRLTAIEYVGKSKWLFKCDCGKLKVIERRSVIRNEGRRTVKSCGCLLKEYSKSKFAKTHGMSQTRFYNIWSSMNDRCYGEKSHKYPVYGGRGIKIEWNNFEEFYKDMYDSYLFHCNKYGEKQMTIDRIDNEKNYSKINCRWATYKIQNKNRNFKK